MLLAVGLFAAGIGTMAFLRNSLVLAVDTQVDALARTDLTSPLMDFSSVDGKLSVIPKDSAPSTEYFVAAYEPVDGQLLAVAGGRGAPQPVFPEEYPLDRAQAQELQVKTLTSSDGTAEYRAAVSVQEYANSGLFYPQMVAVPLATVNRTIASYLGIYSVLAIMTIVGGALLTRFLVTLTFRSLGEVESTADAIAAGDFSQRMTRVGSSRTEVGRLKAAINAMLGRVDAAISQRDATVQQMRRFIGDASHELRTPLVTVRGYAELYRMGAINGDEEISQSMERIEKEAVRMGLLVEDLLALARLDERRDVVVAPVDLRPIARDAALDVRAASPQRPVTVIDSTKDVAAGTSTPESAAITRPTPPTSPIARAGATFSLLRRRPRGAGGRAETTDATSADTAPIDTPAPPSVERLEPIVSGDENRIRQVVTNLLGNARRFSPPDSPIELRVGVSDADRTGWIEIIDHGEGIPDQIKEKIFQRFWRADTSRARETGGTGLGLSIVSSIVEALHGSVTVTDTDGGGATFRVAFPLEQARDVADHEYLETQPLPRIAREES
ncbi:HAMP domain-containing sensor histidine kinase [Microbacterium sp. C7(2022)]|uniref:sensor histidine kinase n=1 Tax=Microbacterium sp. C7(2022) TaxID=2992759 RepID=UPI00237C1FD8|nr:HAMP domain-containing sensor histidine kinase [Microbacterium sp. C7(2022)]MDE0547113.1 HAMP domain-containing histidine kinase [Microbacterium sp. C7(2022)]